MTLNALDELARRYGISLVRDGFSGQQDVADETKRSILTGLGIDVTTGSAVDRSLAEAAVREPPVMRAAYGKACYRPAWLDQGRAWGISVQLYEIRSARNWGIGDFRDLAGMCSIAARAGADFVGTNPLHALFLCDPLRCSPFWPSSRHMLNPLYIAVDDVPGFAAEPADAAEIARLRDLASVDYRGVTFLKLAALRRIWRSWQSDRMQAALLEEFARFRAKAGDALEDHALFEAMSSWQTSLGEGSGWTAWPREFHDIDGPAVTAFAADHQDEIAFYAWLQWIADTQLSRTKAHASQTGMRIGLYLDLAVGEAPSGSASWSDRPAFVTGSGFGAPPDMFTAEGQDWGLTPLSPLALAENNGARFRSLMEASMRHCGALRVDHVMSLWQLFFVPESGVPADGAYVRYPIDHLLAILSDLSVEHQTIVIGEDLGNVPDGFRDVMTQSSILSYRILYFEQYWDGFIAPSFYPHLALACLSTHDLPTFKGWWAGDDIGLRLEHGLIDAELAERQREDRRRERRQMMRAFIDSGCLPEQELSDAQAAGSAIPAAFVVAAHRFVGRSQSVLAGVRLADLTGETRPTNLPGTIDSYPNWRLKLDVALEDLDGTALFRDITEAMQAERPRPA